jgi:hypothetical protein
VSATTWPRGKFAGLLAAWGVAVAGGMLLMAAYASAPGELGAPPARWPAGAAWPLDARRPTLLIFLHPRCPCSRASLAELATLMDRCGVRVAARAVVYQPRRGGEEWFPPDLGAALEAIPGLEVSPDPDGEEARRFAVATSGHVLLYGPRGDRLFSGGITPGRGERGDSLGRAELLGRILINGEEAPTCPVYGCPLATPRPDPGQGRGPRR